MTVKDIARVSEPLSFMLPMSWRRKIWNPREATVWCVLRDEDSRIQLTLGQGWRIKILLLS